MDNPNDKKDIQVYFAPVWDCPSCGACNFAQASPATEDDLTNEEFEEIVRETMGLDTWQEIPDDVRKDDLVKFSNIFTCLSCSEIFVSDNPFGEVDGDDDDGEVA